MTYPIHRAPSASARSIAPPSSPGLNPTQLIAAGAALVVVLLAMLLTYVNLVQTQVARGEQFRQQWRASAAPTALPPGTMKVAISPGATVPLASALRF